MHCTTIGAVTLEMDSKLTYLLKQIDAGDVADVADPKSLLALAEELLGYAKQAKADGAIAQATEFIEKAKGLEAIAMALLQGASKVVSQPAPTVSKATSTALVKAPTVSSPTIVADVAIKAPITNEAAKAVLTIDPTKPLPTVPKVTVTVPPVPPVLVSPDTPVPTVTPAAAVDDGLGVVGQVALAGVVLGGIWWWLKRRKR